MITVGSAAVRSNRIFWIIICIIVILGAVLRVYGLTRQSLWLDEANGIRIAEKSFSQIISELKEDVSPPLHYFMLHIWIKIFGPGELSTRVFVAIFGILLIPAIYYVGSSLFNREVGLISAFIASIAQFHVRYSQEVRMYSMLALLGLLSTYFLYRALTTDTRASWVGYTLCTISTIYTHNYGIFIAASGVAFFVIYAITQNTRLRKFLIAQCIIAILYLPWLPILIAKHYGSSAIVGWIPHMRPYLIYETFKVYSGLGFDMFRPAIKSLIMWAGFAVFISCFLAGIFSIRRHKRVFAPYIQNNTELVLLLCYLFVTLAIPMLISIKKPIYYVSRYSIAAWPAFPLILGLGVSKIGNLYGSLTARGVLVFILFVSCVSLYWHHFAWGKSHDDRSIVSFIESKASEDDLIVFVPWWIDVPIDYYLRMPLKRLGYPWSSRRESSEGIQQPESQRKPDDMVDLARSKLAGSSGKIFFVYEESVTWVADMEAVRTLFDESFTKIDSERYGDAVINIYNTKGGF
jgi:mannosyltransferase